VYNPYARIQGEKYITTALLRIREIHTNHELLVLVILRTFADGGYR